MIHWSKQCCYYCFHRIPTQIIFIIIFKHRPTLKIWRFVLINIRNTYSNFFFVLIQLYYSTNVSAYLSKFCINNFVHSLTTNRDENFFHIKLQQNVYFSPSIWIQTVMLFYLVQAYQLLSSY